MSIDTSKCCYYPAKTSIFLQERIATCPTLAVPNNNKKWFLGNTRIMSTVPSFEEKTIKNYVTGVGNDCTYKRVSKVGLTLEVACFKDDVLSLAYGADITPQLTPIVITGETYVVNSLSDAIQFAAGLANVATVVVTDNAGTTTYVEGTDYTVDKFGICIISGGAIVLSQIIKINYSTIAQNNFDLFSFFEKEYTLWFNSESSNANDFLKGVFYKVKLGVANDVNWISDDFIVLKFEGELFADSCNDNEYGDIFRSA